jgi:hypothetical protein
MRGWVEIEGVTLPLMDLGVLAGRRFSLEVDAAGRGSFVDSLSLGASVWVRVTSNEGGLTVQAALISCSHDVRDYDRVSLAFEVHGEMPAEFSRTAQPDLKPKGSSPGGAENASADGWLVRMSCGCTLAGVGAVDGGTDHAACVHHPLARPAIRARRGTEQVKLDGGWAPLRETVINVATAGGWAPGENLSVTTLTALVRLTGAVRGWPPPEARPASSEELIDLLHPENPAPASPRRSSASSPAGGSRNAR